MREVGRGEGGGGGKERERIKKYKGSEKARAAMQKKDELRRFG
jgi:hypothetical protein